MKSSILLDHGTKEWLSQFICDAPECKSVVLDDGPDNLDCPEDWHYDRIQKMHYCTTCVVERGRFLRRQRGIHTAQSRV